MVEHLVALVVAGEFQFKEAGESHWVSWCHNLNDEVSCRQLPPNPELHEVTQHLRWRYGREDINICNTSNAFHEKIKCEPIKPAKISLIYIRTPDCVQILHQNCHLFSSTCFFCPFLPVLAPKQLSANRDSMHRLSVTFFYEFPQNSSDETDFLQWNRVVLILVAVTFGLWPVNVLDHGLQEIKYKLVSCWE